MGGWYLQQDRYTAHIDQGERDLTAIKQSDDGKGYVVRLFNPTDKAQTAQLRVLSAKQNVSFSGYEVKTLRYQDGNLAECSISE